jgi:hypothetical protein
VAPPVAPRANPPAPPAPAGADEEGAEWRNIPLEFAQEAEKADKAQPPDVHLEKGQDS